MLNTWREAISRARREQLDMQGLCGCVAPKQQTRTFTCHCAFSCTSCSGVLTSLGFKRFKVNEGFNRDARHCAIAAGEVLCIDANQALGMEEALHFSRAVADVPLGWIDDPTVGIEAFRTLQRTVCY